MLVILNGWLYIVSIVHDCHEYTNITNSPFQGWPCHYFLAKCYNEASVAKARLLLLLVSRALLSGKLQNKNKNLFWGISRALSENSQKLNKIIILFLFFSRPPP
jgi:hypothetical protein